MCSVRCSMWRLPTNMVDLEPLVREITNNANAINQAHGRKQTFGRAEAIAHIHNYRGSLEREGRIPVNSVLVDDGKTLTAVES